MSIDQEMSRGTLKQPNAGVASTVAGHQCGSCETLNNAESKFCTSCGQSLFEACAACKATVLLSQRFCNSCGSDLHVALQAKRDRNESLVVDAVKLVQNQEFDAAIVILRQVVKAEDYRIADSIEKAKQSLSRAVSLRDRAHAKASQSQTKAKQAAQGNDHERVVSLLNEIPEHLLSDESQSLLRQSRATLEQLVALNAELQAAMKVRDWKLLGSLVNQLLSLAPGNANYQQIAVKVSERLFSSAKKRFVAQQFDGAADYLDSIPDCQRDDSYDQLAERIGDFRWMNADVDREPFATPSLGRLAVRLAKQCPSDINSIRVKELAGVVKREPIGRHGRNGWKGTQESWMGGKLGVLSRFQLIKNDAAIAKQLLLESGMLNVAIGLAIQGIGAGRVRESFLPSKKGLLRSLGRKQVTSAWGIDVGATGMRAVLVSLSGGDPNIEQIYTQSFGVSDILSTRSGEDKTDAVASTDGVVLDALKRFAVTKESAIGDVPVWVNLPASEVVNRSLRLPPLKDKQAAIQLEQETASLLPMDVSELCIVRCLAPLSSDTSKGRPALIAAARRSVVDQRVKLFSDAGLVVAGVQSDPIALGNLVALEFAEQLAGQSSDEAEPAVALVESGALSTSAIVVTARSMMIWSFENGGEDLTKVIARESKTTLTEADALKRDPASMPRPAAIFQALEPGLQSLRQRLQRAMSQIQKDSAGTQITGTGVTGTWVSGGATRGHAWIRTVLAK